LGVGVAGLQAIATAKRLGAVIEASDVRPSVKEQIESLGGKFIDVPYETDEEREAAEGVGGYAKPMPPSWLARQRAEVAKRVALADVVITTALIPGRAAPTLVSEDMVQSMKPGSVIVDMAAGRGPNGHGGNCRVTQAGQTVTSCRCAHGWLNQPGGDGRRPTRRRFTRATFWTFSSSSPDADGVNIDMEDDIVAACLVTRCGEVTRS
jgi:NAD(P) transhydrogenase subunit alpha